MCNMEPTSKMNQQIKEMEEPNTETQNTSLEIQPSKKRTQENK